MEKKSSSWQMIKRFFEPVIAQPKPYVVAIIFCIIFGLYDTYLIVFLRNLTASIESNNFSDFKFWIIILGIISILIFVIRFIHRTYVDPRITRILGDYLDGKYLHKLMKAENTYIEKLGTGRVSSIIWKGTTGRLILLYDIVIANIYMPIIFILSIFYISKYSPSFIWIFIGFIVFSTIWIWLFRKKNVIWRKKAKEYVTEMDRMYIRQVMSKFEIVQSGKINEEINKRKTLNSARQGFKIKEKFRQSICYDGVVLGMQVIFVIMVTIVGLLAFKGEFKYAELVLVIGLGQQIVSQLAKIAGIMRSAIDHYTQVEKLRETFDDNSFIKGDNINIGDFFTYKKGNILIKNISFSYEPQNPVFQDFSLDIKGGKRTAFVGESGGGKTTLIKLLAGYIRSDKGDIIIDEQKLSKIKLTDYYQHIGYLTQEPSVFDGTIYENLVYALNKEPSKQDLEKVIKNAKCEFIREFENGLETEIGERGVRLSGGQKQRLAIAKIMLKNPNIILLDEPTSALDSFNEEQISIALHNLFKGKTVIIVAHRLQTVKQADRILLLEKGKIIEEGTHDELVKKEGKYKKMLDLQSGF